MELSFRVRQGQTYLAEQYAQSPLKILRPFALKGGGVLLQVLNVGPGVMAGDHFALNVHLAKGAKVVLVNQSATKLHTMSCGRVAEQTIEIMLEDGAALEYYPGLTIPYKESEFSQQTLVRLKGSACFALLERWSMGRIAFDERHVFRRIASRLRILHEDKPLYADALELRPETSRLMGVTDGHDYIAAGVWLWPSEGFALHNEIAKPQRESTTLVAGALEEGFYLRALAQDGLNLAKDLKAFVAAWREHQTMPELSFELF